MLAKYIKHTKVHSQQKLVENSCFKGVLVYAVTNIIIVRPEETCYWLHPIKKLECSSPRKDHSRLFANNRHPNTQLRHCCGCAACLPARAHLILANQNIFNNIVWEVISVTSFMLFQTTTHNKSSWKIELKCKFISMKKNKTWKAMHIRSLQNIDEKWKLSRE